MSPLSNQQYHPIDIKTMITAISSKENTIKSEFDLRFGRAAFFCLHNDVNDTIEFIKNPYLHLHENAGMKVTEMLKKKNVQKVISGDFGPKAQEKLEQHAIQMVILPDDSRNIENIIELLNFKPSK